MNESEFLTFTECTEVPASRKTKIWHVRSKNGDNFLGDVTWYAPWRRYVFAVGEETLLDSMCLEDIAKFLKERTLEHKSRLDKFRKE